MEIRKMENIKINNVENNADLYCHYSGQVNAQGCFIWVNLRDREMGADYNPEIGNAVPADVYKGTTRRYYLPAAIYAKSANRLMEHILPLAESLLSTYDGRETQYMFDIENKIESFIDNWLDGEDFLTVYDVSDWFANASNDDLGITADTTDEQIAEIVKNLDSTSDMPDVLEGDVEQYLIDRRDKAVDAEI